MTKEKLRNINELRITFLVLGIITLPLLGLGLIFLEMSSNLKNKIKEYENNQK